MSQLKYRTLVEVCIGRIQEAADRIVGCVEHELVPHLQLDILGYKIGDACLLEEVGDRRNPSADLVVLLPEYDASFGGVGDGIACVGGVQSDGEAVQHFLLAELRCKDLLTLDAVEQRENGSIRSDGGPHQSDGIFKMMVLGCKNDQVGWFGLLWRAVAKGSTLSIEEDSLLLIPLLAFLVDQKADMLPAQQIVQPQSVKGSYSPASDKGDVFHSVTNSSTSESSRSSSSMGMYSLVVCASS
ncbi:hypothetical protein DSECCO2_567800 [anaerobic digester metagenome]